MCSTSAMCSAELPRPARCTTILKFLACRAPSVRPCISICRSETAMTEIAVPGALQVPKRQNERGAATFLARAIREPFLHFLLLGALLFAVNEYLEQRSKFTHVRITPQIVEGISTNYALQYGTPPTRAQLESLVDEYVREEVFYHEALKRGLDRDDEII